MMYGDENHAHKIIPLEVATGITLDMDRPDLGHPDDSGLWDRLHGHCNHGQVVCANCRRPIYLQERGNLRIACVYTDADIAAWAAESDHHHALKDFVCRSAERSGLTARQESASVGRTRVTDVVVSDGRTEVGWEVQLSPTTPSTLIRRLDRAVSDRLVPSWLTATGAPGRSVLMDRTPLTTINDMSLLEIMTAEDIKVRGALKQIKILECGSWHRAQTWHRSLKCTGFHAQPAMETEKVPTLSRMIESTANGNVIPIRWPRPVRGYKNYWLWATKEDARRFRDAEGIPDETAPGVQPATPIGDAAWTRSRWHVAARVEEDVPGAEPIAFQRITPQLHGTSAAGWHLSCGRCGTAFTDASRHERTTLCTSCADAYGWTRKRRPA